MKTLIPNDVRRIGIYDNASRWYPDAEIAEYFKSIRRPSRAWPFSYYKAAMTGKFYKWLKTNKPEILQKLGY